jgi:hypothetical protein
MLAENCDVPLQLKIFRGVPLGIRIFLPAYRVCLRWSYFFCFLPFLFLPENALDQKVKFKKSFWALCDLAANNLERSPCKVSGSHVATRWSLSNRCIHDSLEFIEACQSLRRWHLAISRLQVPHAEP